MTLTKTSLAIIAITCALALSPSSRAQTNTPPAGGRQGGRQGGRMSVDTQLTRLNEQLKLTDDQKTKVKAVLEDQNKKMQELRNAAPEDRRPKMQALRQDQTKQMKEILTAEQFKKYEQQQQRGNRGAGGAGGQNRNRNRNGAGNAGNPAGAQ